MTDYTIAEVADALRTKPGYVFRESGHKIRLRGESVEIILVASHGGEDEGPDCWVIAKIGDQLFRKKGYYTSHEGTYWDGPLTEVRPEEKTVTVYTAV